MDKWAEACGRIRLVGKGLTHSFDEVCRVVFEGPPAELRRNDAVRREWLEV